MSNPPGMVTSRPDDLNEGLVWLQIYVDVLKEEFDRLQNIVRDLRGEDWDEYFSCCAYGDYPDRWTLTKQGVAAHKAEWDAETEKLIAGSSPIKEKK